MLWMEPSANCNLDCPECPTAASRIGGQMKFQGFVRVIDQIPWLRLINLWFRGEPLVAPDLPDMVAECTRRRILTQTHTNGILLSHQDRAARLVEAGLTRVTVGVDGADDETYRRIRTGGSLKEVEDGIKALVQARRRLHKRRPKIIAECLLSNQRPEQFRQVRALALSWGADEVKFKTFRVSKPDDLEASLALLPRDPALWRYERRDGALAMKGRCSRCRRLSWSAVVAWDGEVYPCCFWTHTFASMGNAFRAPWKEIWRGEDLRRVQMTVNAKRQAIPVCRNCTEGLKALYLPQRMLQAEK
jgi:radical SAM protein with 4Fe4S-binding SPASM domain